MEITVKEMHRTTDFAPVQYEGELSNGESFYFRARWESWSFDVAGTPIFEEDYGDKDFAASHMPHDVAERIIHDCVRRYGEQKGGQ